MNHSVKRRRQALHQTHHHYYLNISVEAAHLSDWRIESNRIETFLPELECSTGCNVNAAGFEQKTALHYAAARGLDPCLLLTAGADPRARDAADNTPLHAAAAGGHAAVVRALVSRSDLAAANGQGRTALHLSASKGEVACLEAIVDAAGPRCCTAVDASGHLPAYYSAYNGHYDATVFFISVNAPLVNRDTGKQSACYTVGSQRPHRCCHLRIRLRKCWQISITVKSARSCGGPGPHLTYGSLGPASPCAKRHIYRFSRFCRAHACDQQTRKLKRQKNHATCATTYEI